MTMTAVPHPAENLSRSAPAEPMSDALALSCLLDAELGAAAQARALDRLLSDSAAQSQWTAMHLVGDALRSSEVGALHRSAFVARCSVRLAAEPTIAAPRWARERRLVRRVVLPGTAVVAAAAMLAVVALPQLRGTSQPAAVATNAPASTNNPAAAPTVAAVTAVQPSAASGPQTVRPMAPYLQAHREIAPSGVLPARAPYLRTSTTVPAEGGQ
jgi:sigma-E factor negative regulatory protein RseA